MQAAPLAKAYGKRSMQVRRCEIFPIEYVIEAEGCPSLINIDRLFEAVRSIRWL